MQYLYPSKDTFVLSFIQLFLYTISKIFNVVHIDRHIFIITNMKNVPRLLFTILSLNLPFIKIYQQLDDSIQPYNIPFKIKCIFINQDYNKIRKTLKK